MQNFRDLKIWEKSLMLSEAIYRATSNFPKSEQYGITSQLRRASTSIGANIAEGSARESQKEFAHFINIAIGSAAEVDYFIELALRLNYIKIEKARSLYLNVNEIRKMLIGLKKKLKT